MKVAEIVTEKIVKALEQEIVPWHKPWRCKGIPDQNLFTKRPYSGINTLLTALECYASPYWGTYHQVAEHGGNIQKGEHSTMIVFWTFIKDKKDERKTIPILKYFNVFNIDQMENIPVPEFVIEESAVEPLDKAEEMFGKYFADGPALRFGGDRAFYSPSQDLIALPEMKQFDSQLAYYETLAHEAIHSTGYESRLNRKVMGHESYSKEELIAEIGACMVLSELSLEPMWKNSASYIKGWMEAIKADPMMIVSAAGKADKATKWILGERNNDES